MNYDLGDFPKVKTYQDLIKANIKFLKGKGVSPFHLGALSEETTESGLDTKLVEIHQRFGIFTVEGQPPISEVFVHDPTFKDRYARQKSYLEGFMPSQDVEHWKHVFDQFPQVKYEFINLQTHQITRNFRSPVDIGGMKFLDSDKWISSKYHPRDPSQIDLLEDHTEMNHTINNLLLHYTTFFFVMIDDYHTPFTVEDLFFYND